MCLQDYLVKWPKTLMVVSHARDFLNVVCTDMLYLHNRKLTSYKGDFDASVKSQTARVAMYSLSVCTTAGLSGEMAKDPNGSVSC